MKVLAKILKKKKDPFYDFIAGPPTKEKEAILREVAKKASKDQRDLIKRSCQLEQTVRH